ncbi:MAG: hypothetical protein LCH43_13950 [Actinobacteria bacterium]|nr:hypothetical protein [Actinomycetota bacterium]
MVSPGDRVYWRTRDGEDRTGIVTDVGNGSTSSTGDPLCSVVDDEGWTRHARGSQLSLDAPTDRLW